MDSLAPPPALSDLPLMDLAEINDLLIPEPGDLPMEGALEEFFAQEFARMQDAGELAIPALPSATTAPGQLPHTTGGGAQPCPPVNSSSNLSGGVKGFEKQEAGALEEVRPLLPSTARGASLWKPGGTSAGETLRGLPQSGSSSAKAPVQYLVLPRVINNEVFAGLQMVPRGHSLSSGTGTGPGSGSPDGSSLEQRKPLCTPPGPAAQWRHTISPAAQPVSPVAALRASSSPPLYLQCKPMRSWQTPPPSAQPSSTSMSPVSSLTATTSNTSCTGSSSPLFPAAATVGRLLSPAPALATLPVWYSREQAMRGPPSAWIAQLLKYRNDNPLLKPPLSNLTEPLAFRAPGAGLYPSWGSLAPRFPGQASRGESQSGVIQGTQGPPLSQFSGAKLPNLVQSPAADVELAPVEANTRPGRKRNRAELGGTQPGQRRGVKAEEEELSGHESACALHQAAPPGPRQSQSLPAQGPLPPSVAGAKEASIGSARVCQGPAAAVKQEDLTECDGGMGRLADTLSIPDELRGEGEDEKRVIAELKLEPAALVARGREEVCVGATGWQHASPPANRRQGSQRRKHELGAEGDAKGHITPKSKLEKRRRERINEAFTSLRKTINAHGDMAAVISQAVDLLEKQERVLQTLRSEVLLHQMMTLR